MRVEFVVGSRFAREGFSPGSSVCLSPEKPTPLIPIPAAMADEASSLNILIY